jgi:hypothetical protein
MRAFKLGSINKPSDNSSEKIGRSLSMEAAERHLVLGYEPGYRSPR